MQSEKTAPNNALLVSTYFRIENHDELLQQGSIFSLFEKKKKLHEKFTQYV